MALPTRTRSGKTVQWHKDLTADTEEADQRSPPPHLRAHGSQASSAPRDSRAREPASTHNSRHHRAKETADASTHNTNTHHHAKKIADVTAVGDDVSQGNTTSHQATYDSDSSPQEDKTTDALVSDSWGRLDEDDSDVEEYWACLLYTSPSPRDSGISRMPSSA